jgi:hypothetical protein
VKLDCGNFALELALSGCTTHTNEYTRASSRMNDT